MFIEFFSPVINIRNSYSFMLKFGEIFYSLLKLE